MSGVGKVRVNHSPFPKDVQHNILKNISFSNRSGEISEYFYYWFVICYAVVDICFFFGLVLIFFYIAVGFKEETVDKIVSAEPKEWILVFGWRYIVTPFSVEVWFFREDEIPFPVWWKPKDC